MCVCVHSRVVRVCVYLCALMCGVCVCVCVCVCCVCVCVCVRACVQSTEDTEVCIIASVSCGVGEKALQHQD